MNRSVRRTPKTIMVTHLILSRRNECHGWMKQYSEVNHVHLDEITQIKDTVRGAIDCNICFVGTQGDWPV